jgi:spermidine/putrescine transport system substrate-binding protein
MYVNIVVFFYVNPSNSMQNEKIMRFVLRPLLLFVCLNAYAGKTLQIAAYGGEIPLQLIKKFEQQTGIKVHLTTFESNENLFLKLKSSRENLYDLITPSNYYVNRLEKFNMLEPLQKDKIKDFKDIETSFFPKDKKALYGIPFVWGATGIFYNEQFIHHPPTRWLDLWSHNYKEQLLLIDDTREVFSIALLALGLSPNEFNQQRINEAYLKLQQLTSNIKLFASDALPSIITDEDAIIGMAWNGDINKVQKENPHVKFIYPEEGFVIWAECFSIPKHAKHIEEAYTFINFMLNPEHAAEITTMMHYPVTNSKAKQLLPPSLTGNPLLFPERKIIQRGFLQQDAPEQVIQLYSNYWEQFKMSL